MHRDEDPGAQTPRTRRPFDLHREALYHRAFGVYDPRRLSSPLDIDKAFEMLALRALGTRGHGPSEGER